MKSGPKTASVNTTCTNNNVGGCAKMSLQSHSRHQSPLFFWSAPRTRTLATAKNTRSRGRGIIGSLRNEDGDGNEDFILKYDFALFISLRNYFMSFRVKNV